MAFEPSRAHPVSSLAGTGHSSARRVTPDQPASERPEMSVSELNATNCSPGSRSTRVRSELQP
jgi:hypothetical protein